MTSCYVSQVQTTRPNWMLQRLEQGRGAQMANKTSRAFIQLISARITTAHGQSDSRIY